MKPRYQKKKPVGCPQWILSGIREKYQQAISKTATPGGIAKEVTDHGKETGRNATEPSPVGIA
jgi:hypothetical protein